MDAKAYGHAMNNALRQHGVSEQMQVTVLELSPDATPQRINTGGADSPLGLLQRIFGIFKDSGQKAQGRKRNG